MFKVAKANENLTLNIFYCKKQLLDYNLWSFIIFDAFIQGWKIELHINDFKLRARVSQVFDDVTDAIIAIVNWKKNWRNIELIRVTVLFQVYTF